MKDDFDLFDYIFFTNILLFYFLLSIYFIKGLIRLYFF